MLMHCIVLSDVFGYRPGGGQEARTCSLFSQSVSTFELVKVAQDGNPS